VPAPRPDRLDQLTRRPGRFDRRTGTSARGEHTRPPPRSRIAGGHAQRQPAPNARVPRTQSPSPAPTQDVATEPSPSMPHGQSASACPNPGTAGTLSLPGT
jgi:hypothetical protein